MPCGQSDNKVWGSGLRPGLKTEIGNQVLVNVVKVVMEALGSPEVPSPDPTLPVTGEYRVKRGCSPEK